MNILYLGDINSIHDFKWISFFSSKSNFKVYFVTEKECYNKLTSKWKSKLEEHNITVLPPIQNFSIGNPVASFSSIKQLKGYINFYKIEVFHALFGSPQAIWLNFLPKTVKKVITTRGSDIFVLLKEVLNIRSVKNQILGKLLLSGFRKADFIASTSDKQIDFLKDCGIDKEKMKLIKTGVDIQDIQAQLKSKAFKTKKEKFVFSARYIGSVYNMDYQIDAIRKLSKETLSQYSFLFSKLREDNSQLFNDTIAKLDSIEGLEYDICEGLTQEQMWSTLKASAVTYMVPKSDGTPNTALECMAGRVPLIMGSLDYNKELFSNVCISVDLSNPADFTSKLESSLKEYPIELLDRAESIVKKFGSRKAEMKKLLALYLIFNFER